MEHVLGKLDVMVRLLIVTNGLERELKRERESVEDGSYHSCVQGEETEACVRVLLLMDGRQIRRLHWYHRTFNNLK